jgi:hypothetical protein
LQVRNHTYNCPVDRAKRAAERKAADEAADLALKAKSAPGASKKGKGEK